MTQPTGQGPTNQGPTNQGPTNQGPAPTGKPAAPGQPGSRVQPPPQTLSHIAPAPAARGGFKRGFGAGFGWALGAGLVALVVGAVTTGIFTLGLVALGSSADSSSPTEVTTWGEATAEHKIVSIPIQGVILGDSAGQPPLFGQGTYGYDIAKKLDALDAEDADAVVLELNTPGGTIYGSRAISDAVERYQKRTDNPVVAYVRGMSASGGMYAMAGADKIIVDHGTMLGSIGVIMGPFSRYHGVTAVDGGLLGTGVTTSGGVEEYYISRGKGKDMGNPYRDMTPEERANLDTWMDAEYTAFVDHVATRRDVPAQTIVDSYGAYMFGPKQAIDNKLADAEMGQDEAYREIATLADVDPEDTRVVMDQSDANFLSLLLGGASSVQPGSAAADPAAAQTHLSQGQAAIRASAVCTGSATVLAINTDLAQVCSS